MRKKLVFFCSFIMLLMFFNSGTNVYAKYYENNNTIAYSKGVNGLIRNGGGEKTQLSEEDENLLKKSIDSLNLETVDDAISNIDNDEISKLSIEETILKAIKGELDLSPSNILNKAMNIFLGELIAVRSLAVSIIIVAILTGLLRNLSTSTSRKSISELCFYVNYIVVIGMIIASFKICVDVTTTVVTQLCLVMNSLLPIMFTLMILSGKVTSTYVFNSVIVFFINFISGIIKTYIVPLLVISGCLNLVNFISDREVLKRLCELIQKIVGVSLKVIAGVFVSVLSLQSVSVPIVNNFAVKTGKSVLTAVPVVGAALTGAVDSLFYSTQAIKGGLMVTIIIVIATICIVPILKLTVCYFIYKLAAAIIEPICDERIAAAIDSISGYLGLLISCVVTVSFMFIFTVIILLGVV